MTVAGKGGAPKFFEKEEDLQKKVDAYFKGGYRKRKVFSKSGEAMEVPAITITDLAIFLGFSSRQSIYDYEKDGEFSYIIKRARLFVEREYEERLNFDNSTGAIFALKNMGWKDKSEVESSGSITTKVTVGLPEEDEE